MPWLKQKAKRDVAVREEPFNVLFLCTGNSARSIIAEAILNKIGGDKFNACSAGSQPKGEVNPNTIKLLNGLGYDMSELSSKSWNDFAKPGAPQFDFIFTVCDDAAGETCPVWPGKPASAHWGIADPAAVTGSEVEIAQAFQQAYRHLFRRIDLFAALPFDSLDKMALAAKLKQIAGIEGATGKAKQG
jgi:arsenate reductase